MKKKLLLAAFVLFVSDLWAGDVNGDGAVDVADIAAIIDVMAGNPNPSPLTPNSSADVNGDGAVDVADIAAVISIMAGEQPQTGQQVNITEAKGWHETVYAKWDLVEGVKGYNVYIKGVQYNDWTKIDQQLVRNYGTYGRADVVGLMAGTYELKVAATDEEGQELADVKPGMVSSLEVKSYPRQGFAFMGGYSPGAYNADGTLKQGAKVFYVTKKTAKTISTSVVTSTKGTITECTGIQHIITAYEKGCDTTPIAFRFIGLLEKEDLDSIGSSAEGIQIKGRKADSEMNMTLEGIGDDATLRGFGFLVRNTKGVEFRNIAIMRCMDDGISMDTDNSNIWVHHCDFFYGKHGSGDHDKGDGQVDVKADSKLVTVSYNHFWDTGKTNMFGMKDESGPNYISYDHNWFDHSDSRHPRVRTMTVHVWNNYFDNVAKYGVGATTGSSVFVENNYFLKTKKPILNSLQGTDALGSGTFSDEQPGYIKAYGNYFDRSATNFKYYTQSNPTTTGFDAYEASSRDEQITDETKLTYFIKKDEKGNVKAEVLANPYAYNNFDTNPQLMYDYTPEAATDVPETVTGFYGAGRLNHGDFAYTFKDNVGNDDEDSAYDSVLGGLLDSYKTSLVGLFGEESQGGNVDPVDPDNPDNPDNPTVPEGTILASFDGAPSNSMFTAAGDYGDGKSTYEGTYCKKGVKLNSKGSVTFTPQKDYQMTLVLATAKTGRDVTLNGQKTTVGGKENVEGAYYEMEPISIAAGTQHVITKGSAESILMFIKLVPVE
ncbi:MAG: pectate lyase [Prevotella sp.]|nr:pectate lyase [Prevotella sp.]